MMKNRRRLVARACHDSEAERCVDSASHVVAIALRRRFSETSCALHGFVLRSLIRERILPALHRQAVVRRLGR
jgi:hypothetical protein